MSYVWIDPFPGHGKSQQPDRICHFRSGDRLQREWVCIRQTYLIPSNNRKFKYCAITVRYFVCTTIYIGAWPKNYQPKKPIFSRKQMLFFSKFITVIVHKSLLPSIWGVAVICIVSGHSPQFFSVGLVLAAILVYKMSARTENMFFLFLFR